MKTKIQCQVTAYYEKEAGGCDVPEKRPLFFTQRSDYSGDPFDNIEIRIDEPGTYYMDRHSLMRVINFLMVGEVSAASTLQRTRKELHRLMNENDILRRRKSM